MKELKNWLIVWDKTLIKYYLTWKINKWLGVPEYQYIWYKHAFNVRKEDRIELLKNKK